MPSLVAPLKVIRSAPWLVAKGASAVRVVPDLGHAADIGVGVDLGDDAQAHACTTTTRQTEQLAFVFEFSARLGEEFGEC